MSQVLLFAILGLGLGSIYAALGAGLVLTYEGTGVLNFATAAMATVPVYVFAGLHTYGNLELPLPWVPAWHVGELPMLVSLLISIGVAAVLGALLYLVAARPLRHAPVLARVVASIGVLIICQAAIGLRYGTDAVRLVDVLPTQRWRLAGITVPASRVYLAGLVIVVVVALWIWLRRTRTGLAVRAAAENEQAAQLARLNPQRLGMVTWIVATVVTALVMCLAGTVINPLTPTNTTMLVVPGLAAALLARLRSLPVTLVSGLVIGVVASELSYVAGTAAWWPSWAHEGLADAVPFVVIAVALFALGRSLPSRGDDATDRMPAVKIPRNSPSTVAVFAGLAVLALLVTGGTLRFAVIVTLATTLITLSLVVLTGMVGQISLAQASLAGVSAFTLMRVGDALPFPVAFALAVSLSTVAGVLVGLPALRIRGAQLAVITMAGALALTDFVFGNSALTTNDLEIPAPRLGGLFLGAQSGRDIARLPFGLFVLIVVILGFVVVGNLMRGGVGRTWLAVRSNERAAASVGISPARTKLSAFVLASLLAGLGGALTGYAYSSFSSASFDPFTGLTMLTLVYMGGVTAVSGAVVGAALAPLGVAFFLVDRYLDLGVYYQLFSGVALLLTVIFNPVGIVGALRPTFAPLAARLRWPVRRAGPVGVATSGAAPPAVLPAVLPAAPPAAPPERRVGEVVFAADHMTVRFGGLVAVNEVSIQVRAGEIVGLVGPNGSGKTTFIDAVTGFVASSGTVAVDGTAVEAMAAHRRVRHGLARTWQSLELFGDLPVRDNVRVPVDGARRLVAGLRDVVAPRQPTPAQVDGALALVGLGSVADHLPAEMSLGRQKLLGVARALATRPRALLLDEPAAGLDTTESVEFGEHLRSVAAAGIGCLLIDHDMALVMGICDRIYVLEFGTVIAQGPPEYVSSHPAVVAAYLGAPAAERVGS